jgi:hypothetical protein
MRLPGFAAESTLYRTSVHYKTVLLPGQLPAALIGPFPNVLCQPCSLDQSGQCTQYCVHCPTPIPDERCWAAFTPCAPSECCPSGQNPCYVSGKIKFCCPPEQLCCNPETNFCCPPRYSCCDPVNRVCCPPGQECFYGVCCPILDDPDRCPPTGRIGSSNYFFANNCQPITGLTVSLTATADINSSSGFTMQLNADSQQGVDAFQQYVFYVQGNSIQAGIANWQNATTEIVCGFVGVASTPIANGIPQGYTLQITLQYQGNNVSGALFEVLSQGEPVGSQTFLVSQAGCNCNLAGGFQCTGYQSSADLSPITAFQMNIVGPPGGNSTTFEKGAAGNIVYEVSSGALTPLSSPPSCVEPAGNGCTAETSNASYGQLSGCPAQSWTQPFTT